MIVKIGSLGDPENKDSQCRLQQWTEEGNSSTATLKATFWPEGWRQRLCRCKKCLVRA